MVGSSALCLVTTGRVTGSIRMASKLRQAIRIALARPCTLRTFTCKKGCSATIAILSRTVMGTERFMASHRSEERRVGKECRSRRWGEREKEEKEEGWKRRG